MQAIYLQPHGVFRNFLHLFYLRADLVQLTNVCRWTTRSPWFEQIFQF